MNFPNRSVFQDSAMQNLQSGHNLQRNNYYGNNGGYPSMMNTPSATIDPLTARMQMLQMHNKILLAKQQNMMLRQAVAQNYFQPPSLAIPPQNMQQPIQQFAPQQYQQPQHQQFLQQPSPYQYQQPYAPSNQFNPYQQQSSSFNSSPHPQHPHINQQPVMQQLPQNDNRAQYSNNPSSNAFVNNGYNPASNNRPIQSSQNSMPAHQPTNQQSQFPTRISNSARSTKPAMNLPPQSAQSLSNQFSIPSLSPVPSTPNIQPPTDANETLQPTPSIQSTPFERPRPVLSSPRPQQQQQLRSLVKEISSQVTTVQENMQQDKKLHLSIAEQIKEQKKAEKTRLLASLQQSTGTAEDNEDNLPLLPMWKHLLLGHKRPLPSSCIMKMKRLWRAISFAMIVVWLLPQKRAFQRKQQRREKAAKECARSLRIFIEGVEDWLGKLVSLPLQSIVDDATLDFDVKTLGHLKNTPRNRQQLEKALVPLKVRFMALIKAVTSPSLSSAGVSSNNLPLTRTHTGLGNGSPGGATQAPHLATLPPSKVTGFLVGLIEDDNYFPDDFLYPCEDTCITKNSLGGTRGVVTLGETEDDAVSQLPTTVPPRADTADRRHVVPVEIELSLKHNSNNNINNTSNNHLNPTPNNPNNNITDTNINSNTPNVNPVDPPPPSLAETTEPPATIATLKRFVHIAATKMLLLDTVLVRVLITRIILTPWHAQVTRTPLNRNTRKVTFNLRVLASLCYLVSRRLNPSLPTREEVMTKMLLQQKLASATPSAANPTNSTSTKNNNNTTANSSSNNSSNGTDNPVNNTPTVTDFDTPATQEKTSSSSSNGVVTKGVFGAFLRMTGFADTTPGFEDFQEGNVEYALLAPRFSDYDTLTETMKYLLPHGVLQPSPMVSDLLESWVEEVTPLVRQWLDNLVMHVLRAYLHKHYKRLFLQPVVSDKGTTSDGNNK